VDDLAIALALESAESVRLLFMGGLVRRNYRRTVPTFAATVLLLFDATKMGRTSFALFAPLEAS
jgi:hypothetical protein